MTVHEVRVRVMCEAGRMGHVRLLARTRKYENGNENREEGK
jgi:hypothetical protein